MTAHITHTATAIAERLDTLTDFANASNIGDQPPAPTSTVEELATALLLRHHLNQPEMLYDTNETAWDETIENQPDNDRHDNHDRDHQDDDSELPDEPPF
jgi:hypothetical protein